MRLVDIDDVNDLFGISDRDIYAKETIEDAICSGQLEVVDAVPVRHGHWIRHDYADIVDGYYVPEYECSECKNWVKDDTDFCPNCGAKNDGGDGNVTD